MPKNGILLMAIGNPIYSKYAFNLAVSLKYLSPNIPIAIIKNGDSLCHLDDVEQFFFDYKIECPPIFYTEKGKSEYLKAKLYLNELTPFENTLFLDADTIFSPRKTPQQVFTQLQSLHFTMANRGEVQTTSGHSEWVDLKEVRKFYEFDSWYDLSSEFIYWEKGAVSEAIFKTAQQYYNDNVITVRAFAGGKPDEPYFCLSLLKNEFKLHKTPYTPSYWIHTQSEQNKWMKDTDIWNQYYLLSMGGKNLPPRIERIYNNVIKYYGYHKGVQCYPAIHKGKVLKERALI